MSVCVDERPTRSSGISVFCYFKTQTKCIEVIKSPSYSVSEACMFARVGLARFAVIKTLRQHESAV